jgi:hypothetical protein
MRGAATAVCRTCGRRLTPSHIDAQWRGLLPWHKLPGAVATCPGTETYSGYGDDGR